MREAGLDPNQLKYVREVEASYIHRIETILDPVVGAGNIRAQVTADLDFSQTEQMAETYKPNPQPDSAIRSQQTAEAQTTAGGPAGVPGALSNQPPVPATAPITTPPLAGAAGGPGGPPLSSNKNATINYELDKKVTHTKGVPGSIKRLSVAVVVNTKKGPPDKAGKVTTLQLSAAEMKQINDLVREAMGYSKDRGDTLNVANTSFTPSAIEKEVVADIPLWKDPEVIAMGREGFKYAVLLIVGFLLWWRLVKPLLGNLLKTPEPPEEEISAEALAIEEEDQEEQQQHLAFDAKLAAARDLAKQDPKLIANIIKEWMGGGGE